MRRVWELQRIGLTAPEPPIPLKNGLNKVGRSKDTQCNVIVRSVWVSRAHCSITVDDNYVFIKDLESFNGTFVNSARLDAGRLTELKSGDVISLGKVYDASDLPLQSNHFVYKIVSLEEAGGKACVRSNQRVVKRKSSVINADEVKRAREASPPDCASQVSSTSAASPVAVVDLTDDDDHPSKPLQSEPPKNPEPVEAQTNLGLNNLGPPLPPPNANLGNSIASEAPLAHSTFVNGTGDHTNGLNSDKDPEEHLISLLNKLNPNEYEYEIIKFAYEKLKQKKCIYEKDTKDESGPTICPNNSNATTIQNDNFKRPFGLSSIKDVSSFNVGSTIASSTSSCATLQAPEKDNMISSSDDMNSCELKINSIMSLKVINLEYDVPQKQNKEEVLPMSNNNTPSPVQNLVPRTFANVSPSSSSEVNTKFCKDQNPQRISSESNISSPSSVSVFRRCQESPDSNRSLEDSKSCGLTVIDLEKTRGKCVKNKSCDDENLPCIDLCDSPKRRRRSCPDVLQTSSLEKSLQEVSNLEDSISKLSKQSGIVILRKSNSPETNSLDYEKTPVKKSSKKSFVEEEILHSIDLCEPRRSKRLSSNKLNLSINISKDSDDSADSFPSTKEQTNLRKSPCKDSVPSHLYGVSSEKNKPEDNDYPCISSPSEIRLRRRRRLAGGASFLQIETSEATGSSVISSTDSPISTFGKVSDAGEAANISDSSSLTCTKQRRKHRSNSSDPVIERLLNDLDSENSRTSSPALPDVGSSKSPAQASRSVFPAFQCSYSVNDIEAHVKALCTSSDGKPSDENTILEVEDLNDSNEAINLENLSFSQEGVTEVDDNDSNYSSLFLNNCDEDLSNDADGPNHSDSKPIFIGATSIIKDGVNEMHEDAEVELFESHFSQCSQEMENAESVSKGYHETEDDHQKSLESAAEKIDEMPPAEVKNSHVSKRNQITSDKSSAISSSKKPSEVLNGVALVKSTLLSVPPVGARKTRGKKQNKVEPSATRDALNKRKKEKIVEERKAKLKDLALQKKTEAELRANCREDHSEVKENAICPSKVAKITDRTRGNKLLEGFLDQPNSKPKARPMNQLAVQNKNVAAKRSCPTELKSCMKLSPVSSVRTKKVQFSNETKVVFYECEGRLNKLNRLTSKDKAPLPAQSLLNPGQSTEFQSDEVIFHVVRWNTNWINESKLVKGDPPLYQHVFRGKDAFVSYNDYYRWMFPMILYELWGNIVKSLDEKTTHKSLRRYDGVILHKELKRGSPNSRLLTLKCCVPLMSRDIPAVVDPLDNLLVSTNSPGDTSKVLMMFGVVDSQVRITNARNPDPVARRFLATHKQKFDVLCYFDIAVYSSPQKILDSGFHIKIRPTYSMLTEMRQYEGLGALRTSPLMPILIDPSKNAFASLPSNIGQTKVASSFPLNSDQTNAILGVTHLALSSQPNISLIHGPPGTGKTRVIVGIIEQIMQSYRSKSIKRPPIILVCTQSNSAIDEICLRLLDVRKQLDRERRFRLTRFGRKDRVHPKVADILTMTLARNEVERANSDETFAVELEILRAKERMLATALESSRTEEERLRYSNKYKMVQESMRKLEPIVAKTASEDVKKKELERLISEEELKIINYSDIIATTLGSCASRRIIKALNDPSLQKDNEKRSIGVCLIDEATQATEADILMPLVHGVKNLILVGDQQQLSPFVLSETAKANGLSQSLFGRLHKVWSPLHSEDGPPVPLFPLRTQHRMHPEIAAFPSASFYNNELVSPEFLNVNRGYRPYTVVTHSFQQESGCETNEKEAELILTVLDEIVQQPLYKSLSVGIIVPYQKQRILMMEMVRERKYHRLVTVNTIDSYQGQERDVVLLSTVRTNGVGFLSDYQRTNVAITRAKRALYIFGNFSSLQGEPTWKNLLTDAQKRGAHFEVPKNFKVSTLMNYLTVNKKRKRSAK